MNKKRALKSGEEGEQVVSELLSSTLETHYLINNLIVVGNNGITHQIDHIYICQAGVFVIETKNYFGELKGQEDDTYWTRTYKHRNKIVSMTLPNPLKQNKSHLKAVKRIVGKELPLYGFIVLVQNNEQNINLFNVTSPSHLLERFKLLVSDNPLNKQQMEYIYKLLLNAEADVSDLDHINNVKTVNNLRKESQTKIRQAIETRICPYCQGKLELNKTELVCANCKQVIKP